MNVQDAQLDSPVTTTPDETFASLLKRLLASRQATAAVLDDEGNLVGLVGIHDVLRSIVPLYIDLDAKLMEVMHEDYFIERLPTIQHRRVHEFMSREIDHVGPEDSLIKAVSMIVERRRKTLPIVRDGKFLGMITRRSILEKVAPTLL